MKAGKTRGVQVWCAEPQQKRFTLGQHMKKFSIRYNPKRKNSNIMTTILTALT